MATLDQGGPGIGMKDCRSVPFEVALGVELTTYVIIDFAFFGKIRLDVVDNSYTNTKPRLIHHIIVLRHMHVLELQNR